MSFENNVIRILKQKGISKLALSKMMGISAQSVGIVMRHNSPNSNTLQNFSKSLGVTIEELLCPDSENENSETSLNIVTAPQRINEYIKAKGITVMEFEKMSGFSNGSFASQVKEYRSIGSDRLEKIFSIFSDLNPAWVMTGIGDMIKTDIHEHTEGDLSKFVSETPNEVLIRIIEGGLLIKDLARQEIINRLSK